MIQLDYHAAYYPVEGGWYMARVLDFPGVLTQGKDLPRARKMLLSALQDMAEWHLEDGLTIPRPDPTAADPTAALAEPIELILRVKLETPNVAAKTPSTSA